MFQSRLTTQNRKKEIMWDDRVVFLLSLSEQEGKEEEITILEEEDTAVFCPKGRVCTKEPCFGPQEYYEAKEGLIYELDFPEADEFMALYQHKDWWIRPAFLKSVTEIPERTQLLLWKKGTVYFVLIAVCGRECRTDLAGIRQGVQVKMAPGAGGRKYLDDISLVMAACEDPYLCCEKAVKRALAYKRQPSLHRKNKKFPGIFENFGWCTWDAFYHDVSHDGIRGKMQEFRDKQVPVKWVLIDDGWLHADYDACLLEGLDAGKEKFPEGLSGCVRELKEKWGVEKVGVWHAVMGYWNGLKQNSEAETLLKGGVTYLPDGRILPSPEKGRAFTFFDVWHDYLKNNCGIDFVKVDGQSCISLAYGGWESYGKASREIQKGLNASAALHFDDQIINCMGMAGEDMWNRPGSSLSRSSDDFVPEVPGSFAEHALQNSFNSLLQGQFYWGDWDMFFSSRADNVKNSILRALSGGPVYVSDKTGETDPEYIYPLLRENGSVIRCDNVGVPTLDCLLHDPLLTGSLKIWNQYGENYLIGAFAMGEHAALEGRLSVSDIPGLKGKNWYVYHYGQEEMRKLRQGEAVPFSFSEKGAELFLLVPDKKDFQMVGILEKYVACGCAEVLSEEKNRIVLRTEAAGTLGFISARPVEKILAGGKEIQLLSRKENFYLAGIPDCGSLVEIYLEGGMKEL